MHVELRRAPKWQGRGWIITINGREASREATAKEARRVARSAKKFPKLDGSESPSAHLFESEPLDTQ